MPPFVDNGDRVPSPAWLSPDEAATSGAASNFGFGLALDDLLASRMSARSCSSCRDTGILDQRHGTAPSNAIQRSGPKVDATSGSLFLVSKVLSNAVFIWLFQVFGMQIGQSQCVLGVQVKLLASRVHSIRQARFPYAGRMSRSCREQVT